MPRRRRPGRQRNPDAEATLDQELVNWTGRALPVIAVRGSRWVVKELTPEQRRRELLVHALGRGIVNVADVRRLGRRQAARLARHGVLSSRDASGVLVRVAPDHDSERLPLRSLDEAVAGELVLSLWVRRRDADIWNRSHLEGGIPVFFDLNASLEFDPQLADVRTFFARNTYGFAGSWRIRERGGKALQTMPLRDVDDHTNYVDDLDACRAALPRIAAQLLRRRAGLRWRIARAGYRGVAARDVEGFLRRTGATLIGDLDTLWQVARSEVPTPPTGRRVSAAGASPPRPAAPPGR
jgi:hypothetical protein